MGFSGAVPDEYREYAGQAYLSLVATITSLPQEPGEAQPRLRRVPAR